MKDIFYTLLVVWIIWRIMGAFSTYGNRRNTSNENTNETGKTTIKHSPHVNKKINDDEGEYVDFEEIK